MDKDSLKIFLVVIGMFLILGLSIYSVDKPRKSTFTSTLDSYGYGITGFKNYSLKEVENNKIAGVDITEISAKKGKSIIQVRIFSDVSEEFSENYIESRRNELAAIYTDIPAPYEGIPAKETDCPDKFTPQLNTSYNKKTEFYLYSDDNMNIGACSNSTAKFRTLISMLYCKESNNFIRVKKSKPIDEDDFNGKIFCKKNT